MANVAQKYAQALYDVVSTQNVLSEVYEEFTEINAAVARQMNDLKSIDYEPKITMTARHQIVENVFSGVQPFLMNTLKIVAGHRHLYLLPEIFKAFEAQYYADQSLADAYLESASVLDEEEVMQVKEALIKRTGLKDLIIHATVNESLIGGVRVKIGTKVYDGSIQNDLNQLVKKFNRAH
ncbi:F0F1 ATP synthase subunit delta [Staphylococcus lutrae]|uniref:ATP synthase subunit delta n=1 Tax=Staphylococcus lutrae TaxID=155085 RepID=A0AAC9RNC7_9STAP|nr:F0F1 ATP synthase subunit delta [Staphylococcus lutrae]ARJ50271.1 F0F1 ATP synthase subunit delta [Staphylococcus lutrae]PNZ40007.1 F0F1 ATP synthase subunit delta [Staphylococcus lutrae]